MVGKPKVGDREKHLAKDWFEELRDEQLQILDVPLKKKEMSTTM